MEKVFFLIILSLIIGCSPIRNSPFSEDTDSPIVDFNQTQTQLLRLKADVSDSQSEIVLGVFADSHQNYAALEDWVRDANNMPLDFAVSLGDFTNQGLNFEYDAYINLISGLKIPLVTVIGNHDSVAKGKLLYKRLFGPYNFYFDFKGYRFIAFNNNRLDFIEEGIDWNWLQREVRLSPLPVVVMTHIDPDNHEYFRKEDRQRFWETIQNSQVRLILNGHKHIFHNEFKAGSLRHQVERLERGKWTRISLQKDVIQIEHCQKRECHHEVLKDFSTYDPSMY